MNFINYGKRPVAKPKVVMAESTKAVLEEEKIVITEDEKPAEIVQKVKKKTKKAVAKITEDGDVEIKQSLNG
jgi:hypothetical protein